MENFHVFANFEASVAAQTPDEAATVANDWLKTLKGDQHGSINSFKLSEVRVFAKETYEGHVEVFEAPGGMGSNA